MTAVENAVDASPMRRMLSLAAVVVATFIVALAVGLPLPTTMRGWATVVAATVVGLLLWAFVLPRVVRPLGARMVLLAIVAAGTGYFLLEPLFADDVVNERLPVAAPPVPEPTVGGATEAPRSEEGSERPRSSSVAKAPPSEAAARPERVAGGALAGINHRAAGGVGLYQLPNGSWVVRLEDADMENGPDLWVYLVPEPGQDHDGGAARLGRLKGNIGSSNYPVPADVDPADFATVLIWCRAFSTPFANATLSPV